LKCNNKVDLALASKTLFNKAICK